MTKALVDTTVIIHLFRPYAPALAWYASLAHPLSLTPVTWLEVIYGAGSKTKQANSTVILSQFDLIYLTAADQDWAIEQMKQFSLSHGITANDCLIASVAHRLNVPLYTHNLKDMTPMIGSLAVKPYS